MGLRARGVVRCGRCRKPRGLFHTCVSTRRKGKTRLQAPFEWHCTACGKRHSPFAACTVRTDFRKRRRRAAAAARKRKRKAVAARRAARRKAAAAERRARALTLKTTARRSSRPRSSSQHPVPCGDRGCQKYGCKAYWQGYEAGLEAAPT